MTLEHALQRIAALTQALPGALRFMEAHHECDACASENITDIMPQCDDCGEAGYCAKRVLDALRRAARVLSPEEGR